MYKALVLILLSIILIIVINNNVNNKRIIVLVECQTIRDSLYLEHLKTCAFFDKTQFRIGYDNYVQKIGD